MWLKQTEAGSWRVIVQHQGAKRTGTAPTKAEAQMLGAELLLSIGGTQPSTTVSVAELIAMWHAESTLSATYRADAKAAVSQHVPSEFMGRQVSKVTTPAIHALYVGMTAKGVSPHRVRRIHGVLRSAWKLAIREGWATADPTEYAKLPAVETPAVVPPDPAVVGQLLDALAKRPQLELFLRLAASTGARRGELIALQWDDVVVDAKQPRKRTAGAIRIRRSIGQVPGEVEIRATKTGIKGHRTVAIDAGLVDALQAELDRQRSKAITSDGEPVEPLWVFSADAGVSHRRPDYATQAFVKLRTALGIQDVKLHGLRHFVATQLLLAGEPASTVAKRLGHSTSATTLRTYAGYVKAGDQHAAETMRRLTAR